MESSDFNTLNKYLGHTYNLPTNHLVGILSCIANEKTNCAVIFPPSTSKTRVLKWFVNHTENSTYVNCNSVSSSGLFYNKSLKDTGVVFSKDTSVVVLDNFDKMKKSLRDKMDEVISTGELTISLGEEHKTFNTDASFILASSKSFDSYESVASNYTQIMKLCSLSGIRYFNWFTPCMDSTLGLFDVDLVDDVDVANSVDSMKSTPEYDEEKIGNPEKSLQRVLDDLKKADDIHLNVEVMELIDSLIDSGRGGEHYPSLFQPTPYVKSTITSYVRNYCILMKQAECSVQTCKDAIKIYWPITEDEITKLIGETEVGDTYITKETNKEVGRFVVNIIEYLQKSHPEYDDGVPKKEIIRFPVLRDIYTEEQIKSALDAQLTVYGTVYTPTRDIYRVMP